MYDCTLNQIIIIAILFIIYLSCIRGDAPNNLIFQEKADTPVDCCAASPPRQFTFWLPLQDGGLFWRVTTAIATIIRQMNALPYRAGSISHKLEEETKGIRFRGFTLRLFDNGYVCKAKINK